MPELHRGACRSYTGEHAGVGATVFEHPGVFARMNQLCSFKVCRSNRE